MANYMISENTFSRGIRVNKSFITHNNALLLLLTILKNYLNSFSYGNAGREDLWRELEKVANEDSKISGLNFTDVMNTWTLQMGHPLITIERINENSIRISQKQFLLDPLTPPTQPSTYQ